MYACTEERFLECVKNHSMKVIQDNKINRHLTFTNGGSSVYRFDLITWPGHLCIAGDCGTYVFRRLEDMFGFFWMDDNDFMNDPKKRLNIDPGYWGEKLESIDVSSGFMKFDSQEFEERVRHQFDCHFEDSEDEEEKNLCWSAIEDHVLCCDNEHEAYAAVEGFEYGDFRFEDFFDGGGTESYTFHYIWCLYAIVWGIKQYKLNENEKVSECTVG